MKKCTASVNKLKTHLGSLFEGVTFIRQGVQKKREHTTATESHFSDIEDKLPAMMQDSQTTKQLVGASSMWAEDLENCMRRNNVHIVGIAETFWAAI